MPRNLQQSFGSRHAQYHNVVPISPRRRHESTWPDQPQNKIVTRRRGNAAQGRALETLGHAIEYLTDSRIHLVRKHADNARQLAEGDAASILMQASSAVFLSCPQVVSLWDRLRSLYRQPSVTARDW